MMKRKTKRYRVSPEVYQTALEACNYMCVLCGRTGYLELHHILGRGRYLTDCLANCVFLCHNCHHNIVHQNMKAYKPILRERSKEIYGVDLAEVVKSSTYLDDYTREDITRSLMDD